MTKILIKGLKIPTLIGVYDRERHAPQTLFVDIEITFNSDRADRSDDINDTICYDLIAKRLQQWAADYHFHLLETLAATLIDRLLQEFPIQEVKLRIIKPNIIPMADEVSLEMVKSK